VAGIHVGLYLEHETRELCLIGVDRALQSRPRLGRRRVGDECGQKLAHAEIVDGRTEEHRGLFRREIALQFELRARPSNQLNLFEKVSIAIAEKLARLVARDAGDGLVCADAAFFHRYIHVDFIFDQMIDAE
jgi:hypothetical protein